MTRTMIERIQLFMLVEAASFGIASLIHSGVLITGFEHAQARIAEGVIAAVLFVGWAITLARRDWVRPIGLVTQGFALLGTLVGLFTIAVGIGPRTLPDLVFHAGIVVVLLWGLMFTAQAGARPAV